MHMHVLVCVCVCITVYVCMYKAGCVGMCNKNLCLPPPVGTQRMFHVSEGERGLKHLHVGPTFG